MLSRRFFTHRSCTGRSSASASRYTTHRAGTSLRNTSEIGGGVEVGVAVEKGRDFRHPHHYGRIGGGKAEG